MKNLKQKFTHDGELSLHTLSDEDGVFKGMASLTNKLIPVWDQKILPGAFKRTLKHNQGKVPILWQHSPDEMIGFGQEGEEVKRGLAVTGKLAIEKVQRSSETWALMQMAKEANKNIGISIGFYVEKSRQEVIKGIEIQCIEELSLVEYSITPFPANVGSTVTGMHGQWLSMPNELRLIVCDASMFVNGSYRRVQLQSESSVIGIVGCMHGSDNRIQLQSLCFAGKEWTNLDAEEWVVKNIIPDDVDIMSIQNIPELNLALIPPELKKLTGRLASTGSDPENNLHSVLEALQDINKRHNI